MTEQAPEPMPEDVREAFREAIQLYERLDLWSSRASVTFRKQAVSLSGVCDLVLNYTNERLPVNVHDDLWRLIDDTHAKLKVGLAKNPTYATAARCLEILIQDYKTADRRREERRREG